MKAIYINACPGRDLFLPVLSRIKESQQICCDSGSIFIGRSKLLSLETEYVSIANLFRAV